MLYNPLLQLFLRSCAVSSAYQMWRKNYKGAKEIDYFATSEPYMSPTVH